MAGPLVDCLDVASARILALHRKRVNGVCTVSALSHKTHPNFSVMMDGKVSTDQAVQAPASTGVQESSVTKSSEVGHSWHYMVSMRCFRLEPQKNNSLS